MIIRLADRQRGGGGRSSSSTDFHNRFNVLFIWSGQFFCSLKSCWQRPVASERSFLSPHSATSRPVCRGVEGVDCAVPDLLCEGTGGDWGAAGLVW